MLPGVRGFFYAARPFYLPSAWMLFAVGVWLGHGPVDARALVIGALVVFLVHVVTHYVNDAEDEATDDAASPTAFTGGSRAIQRGLVTPAQLLRAAALLSGLVVALVALELALGLTAAALVNLAILVLGYGYSGRPFTFGRRGLGEIVTGLVMAVLAPLAGALAAGGPSPALQAAIPLLFAEMVLARLSTAYPDIDADRATRKWTIPALLGPRGSALAFLVAGAAVVVLGFAAAPLLPRPGLQRLAAVVAGVGAAFLALLAATGRAKSRPALVPLVGLGASGSVLAALLGALLAP
jgi:1,4-dihydroxy-2-naphthoate octaprenyltransferase